MDRNDEKLLLAEIKYRRTEELKKYIKKGFATVMLLSMTALSGCGFGQDKIKLGAAGIGGNYYSFANSYSQLVEQDDDDYEFEIKTTAGSMANLRLLSEGYLDMAIAQSDLIDLAYYGDESQKKYQGYKAVAALYQEACQLVVRADSEIYSVDDLQGKRVSVGEEESGTMKNAEQLLEVSGLVDNLVDTVNLNYIDAAEQLKNGEIDALFCTAGIKTSMIDELAEGCDIRLVALDEKTIDKLISAYPFYESCVVPAGTYAGQTEEITTVGVRSVLLASDGMADKDVERMTEYLFKYSRELQYAISLNGSLEEENAIKGVTIPFHDGAISYYNEKNITIK